MPDACLANLKEKIHALSYSCATHKLRVRSLATLCAKSGLVRDAGLVLKDGRVVFAGPYREAKRLYAGSFEDLGEITLVPGLLNAHCHLELSHLRGQGPQGQGFTAWVAWLIRQPLEELSPAILAQAVAASGLDFRLFFEFFGWGRTGLELAWPRELLGLASAPEPPHLAAAGHALYSTSPELLRLAKAWDNARGLPFTLHLAEHEGEVELLASGKGEFAELLSRRVLPKDYQAPGRTPVCEAQRLGLLDPQTLAVHCVHLTDQDLEILAQSRATLCLCPRSNARIGSGRAPIERILERGLKFCLGTDSLASNQDLDLFAEARELAATSQVSLGLARLLEALCLTPARSLGFAARLGTLEPGKLAKLALLPPDLAELDWD